MTMLVGILAQDTSLVGLIAAMAVMTFLVICYLLLANSSAGYGNAIRSRETGLPIGNPDPPHAARSIAVAPVVPTTTPITPVSPSRLASAIGGAAPPADAPDASDSVDLMRRLRVVPDVSRTAGNFSSTVAPTLRPVAALVVKQAQPRIGDRVLDVGTATGVGAAAALAAVPAVVGVDADDDMLALARREVPGAHFIKAELGSLPFPAAWFHVVISVHALQLAHDPAAVLAEWRRVTIPGGRLSLSLPGPRASLLLGTYAPVYERHKITRELRVATARKLASWARAAGWQQVEVAADAKAVLHLQGPESFGRWLRIGGRLAVAGGPVDVPTLSLERDLLAVTPTGSGGQLRIPFGTLYLTARNL